MERVKLNHMLENKLRSLDMTKFTYMGREKKMHKVQRRKQARF